MSTISKTGITNRTYRQRQATAADAALLTGTNRRLDHALIDEKTRRPRLMARLSARVRGAALDRALVAGIDPVSSSQLEARAAWLKSRRVRGELAGTLERFANSVDDGVVHTHRVMRSSLGAVRGSREELRELAQLLRAPRPLQARGVAMVRQLLTDGAGPLYTKGDEAALPTALRNVRAALMT